MFHGFWRYLNWGANTDKITLNTRNSDRHRYKEADFHSECLLRDICTKIVLMKYKQIQTTTTVNKLRIIRSIINDDSQIKLSVLGGVFFLKGNILGEGDDTGAYCGFTLNCHSWILQFNGMNYVLWEAWHQSENRLWFASFTLYTIGYIVTIHSLLRLSHSSSGFQISIECRKSN